MRTLTLSVDGMRCRRCVRQATALVRDVEGVHVVMADPRTGQITVIGTMTSSGTVIAAVKGGAVADGLGNVSTASTSTTGWAGGASRRGP